MAAMTTAAMVLACRIIWREGLPLPDPNCTPGAIREAPAATDAGLSRSLRAQVYARYNLSPPRRGAPEAPLCRIDHLIPRSLGGATTLANLWPMCGAGFDGEAFFAIKDRRELAAWRTARADPNQLEALRATFARDWTAAPVTASRRAP
jgi:hypothetical protein